MYLIGVAAILFVSVHVAAGPLYWVPAHHLAPDANMNRPAAADLDGDLDYDISGFGVNPVHHHWNVGTPQSPAWELDLTQFPNIPYCPSRGGAFGDADLDGDLDLVVGCWSGALYFYWNVGTPQVPIWEYDASVFAGVSGDFCSQPSLGDLDADGDLDLIVTVNCIGILYFENIGTAVAPSWIRIGPIQDVWFYGCDSDASLGDMDLDGDLDIVASTSHAFQCWENVGTAQSFEFVENPAMLTGIEYPAMGAIGLDVLDIDADGDLDIVVDGFDENFLYLNEESASAVRASSWGTIKAMFR
jgi:hypothetical protein